MQSVSSRIWTHVAVSISYDDNHYTTGTSRYLKSYNCKLFVLEIVTWSSNCLLRVIISYLKSYNCVQTNNYY